MTDDDFIEYEVDVHGTAVVHAKNESEACHKAVQELHEHLSLNHADNARKSDLQKKLEREED